MDPEVIEKLESFEQLLVNTVLQKEQSKVTQSQWLKIYQISMFAQNYDEQE